MMFRTTLISIASLLVLNSCDQENGTIDTPNADRALRGHLGITSMSGTIEVPKDQPFYLSTTFEIVDGKIQRHGPISVSSRENLGSAELRLEVLWDKKERGSKVTISSGGGILADESPFWSNVGNMTNNGILADGPDGFKILAMSQSAVERDGRINEAFNSNFEITRTTKKYLGVAAVKFFGTGELASKYIDSVLMNAESVKELY